jgi:hypothetical protein
MYSYSKNITKWFGRSNEKSQWSVKLKNNNNNKDLPIYNFIDLYVYTVYTYGYVILASYQCKYRIHNKNTP